MRKPIEVLLIEDNPGDVRLVREALADAPGHEASLVAEKRLADGLARLAERAFDIVLLDLGLPDSKGLETLARLQERAPEIPVVVLTGFDDEASSVQALADGAQDYLVKSQVDRHTISRSIRYAIERKAAVRALEEARSEAAADEKVFALEALVNGVAGEMERAATGFIESLFHIRGVVDKAAGRGDASRALAADVTESASTAMAAVEEMKSLLRDLRRFSMSEPRTWHRQGLDEVVRDAVNMFRSTTSGPQRIELSLAATPPIEMDTTRIRQVVLNLLANAAEAMPKGGAIVVETRPAPGGAELRVTDEGPGLSEVEEANVFRPFFTTKPRHVGLGLSVAKGIVEGHGGAVRFETGADRGATFIVFLPATAVGERGAPKAAAAIEAS